MFVQWSHADTFQDTLFFNSGNIQFEISGPSFPYKSLNHTASFSQTAARILLKPGDSLQLFLANNDVGPREFKVRGQSISSGIIPPGAMQFLWLSFSQPGVYQYYDDIVNGEYLGLTGMIVVWDQDFPGFYWSLREHQSDLNSMLSSGAQFELDSFKPDYFSINELSFPAIQNDSAAILSGNVGDTIQIFIQNNGQFSHSLHFHGFHVLVEYSSIGSNRVGWIKDTVPIKPGEGQVYTFIANQPGEYPVHDHNLVATTIGGNSPGGMLLFFEIFP